MSFDYSTKNSNTFSSNKKKQLYNENNPYLNKEQIIIDWINTIKLPHCLLINSINDKEIQENGIIFIEILKYFLKKLGIENFNSDERLNKFQRINLLIMSIIELNKVNNFNLNLNNKLLNFQNNVQELFENKNLMIKFFELIKKIFEQLIFNDSSMEIENYNKNNIIIKNNSSKNKLIKKQNLRNFSLGIYNNNNNNNNDNNNNNYVKLQNLISINNNNNTLNSFNCKSLSENHSISLSISPINPEKFKKIFFEDRLFKNINYNKQKENKTLNVNESNYRNFFNCSNSNNNKTLNNFKTLNNNLNLNNNINICNNNFGIYKSIHNFVNNIPIYKIFNLTKPILNIKLNNNNNENNYIKYNQKIINNKKNLSLKSNSQRHFLNEELCEQFKKKLKLSNKENIRLKIKKWLIKINLLNELSLSEKKNISILYLSYTGLLFCNIINKYNNKAIKGIITNPITKNQNIININKFFDYCKENKNLFYKDIKKYLNLNLILNKNEDIIFKILYVLYNFYNNKEELNNNNNKFNTINNNKEIKINTKINITKLNFDYIFNKQNNNNNFINNFPKTSRNDSNHNKNINLFKKYNNYKNNNSIKQINKNNNNNKTSQNNFINKDSSSLLNLYNSNSEFNINNNNNFNNNINNDNDFFKYFHNNKNKNNNENNNFSNDSVSCSSIIISPSTNSSMDYYDNNYIENLFSKKRFKSSNTKLNNNNYYINNNNLTSQVPNYYLLFNINDNNINNNTCIKKKKNKK